jgi:hypothetical protein
MPNTGRQKGSPLMQVSLWVGLEKMGPDLVGWTGAKSRPCGLDWSKGGQRNISKFFSTMAKKIFLWIYTFQVILRPFHIYKKIQISKCCKSHFNFLKNWN